MWRRTGGRGRRELGSRAPGLECLSGCRWLGAPGGRRRSCPGRWAQSNRNERRTGKSSKNQLKGARHGELRGRAEWNPEDGEKGHLKGKNPPDLAALTMWGPRDASKMTHKV